MITATFRSTLLLLAPAIALYTFSPSDAINVQDKAATPEMVEPKEEHTMQIQYLEIVTPDMDATCLTLGKMHGVEFSKPVPELGNARTAALAGGGQISVRAPMRETEKPVVRPYLLVKDIKSAVAAAESAGAEIAMPPMELPGRGQFAIYILGGIEHGLWQ